MIAIDKSKMPWILLVVFIALFVAGCEKQDMADPPFRAEIESRVGVKFPPSAMYIQCQLDRGMDYRLLCKFTAPKKRCCRYVFRPWYFLEPNRKSNRELAES